MTIDDHPLRYEMANELHARPFPVVKAPARAAYLAIKQPQAAVERDRGADRAHLLALLDRHGAPHPHPGATHYFGTLGRYRLKWESHTEFVTYTVFEDHLGDRPFDPDTIKVFPEDWLAAAPGTRLTSALFRIEPRPSDAEITAKISEWFVPESVAISGMLDDSLVAAGDFRIDPAGHLRFAIFANDNTGARRTGRVVQRICEIETYKTMSMLGLFRVRRIGPQLNAIERRLSDLVSDMRKDSTEAEGTLHALLDISAELETLSSQISFRLGATGAYETIVNQRIEVLREVRFGGRQTFAEFMLRRFDPAMRTVKSSERRLQAMSDRALRAADLLRTQVDVARSAQNQDLLASMDRRSDLQLRLQETVEGLSVVAISYYALNLLLYFIAPATEAIGLSDTVATALAVPVVVMVVWGMIRRIKRAVR